MRNIGKLTRLNLSRGVWGLLVHWAMVTILIDG